MFAKTIAIGAVLGLSSIGFAQGTEPQEEVKPLSIGDPAPKLEIGEWVKGDPIEQFEEGKVYVVEFWATWCGPCIAGMPHVSELQREYKDEGVRIIGVNIWDNPEGVAPFMSERKARDGSPLPSGDELMDYTVAIEAKDDDPRNGRMAKSWMQAAGQNGIPSAFIVDQETRIAWIGHPMSMDEPLKQVVDGTWDVEKAAADARRQKEIMAQAEPLIDAYRQAAGAGDTSGQLKAIDDLLALDEESFAGLKHRKLQILLIELKQPREGYALAKEMVDEDFKDNAQALNGIAWMILTNAPEEGRDTALALRAARRANELTNNEDASILDTLAKAYFESGDLEKAIEHQERAVAKAADHPDMLAELQDRLNEYREAKNRG